MENKPLARTLYTKYDIGDEIPEDLFERVAEVLAYVYRLTRQSLTRERRDIGWQQRLCGAHMR